MLKRPRFIKSSRKLQRGIPHPIKRSRGKIRAKKCILDKGPKLWSLTKADTQFRVFMLMHVPCKCVFPGCSILDPKKLTVSHYFGRAKKGTRYEPRNCDFLCRNHHYWDKQVGWEFQKQRAENPKHGWDGRYTLYMKEKLGTEGFATLETLAESGMKQKVAIKEFQTVFSPNV